MLQNGKTGIRQSLAATNRRLHFDMAVKQKPGFRIILITCFPRHVLLYDLTQHASSLAGGV